MEHSLTENKRHENKRHKGMIVGIAIVSMIFLFPVSAFAYLDPATGTAIIQGLVAAFAATAVALRLYWNRILQLLGLRTPTAQQSDSRNDGSHEDERLL